MNENRGRILLAGTYIDEMRKNENEASNGAGSMIDKIEKPPAAYRDTSSSRSPGSSSSSEAASPPGVELNGPETRIAEQDGSGQMINTRTLRSQKPPHMSSTQTPSTHTSKASKIGLLQSGSSLEPILTKAEGSNSQQSSVISPNESFINNNDVLMQKPWAPGQMEGDKSFEAESSDSLETERNSGSEFSAPGSTGSFISPSSNGPSKLSSSACRPFSEPRYGQGLQYSAASFMGQSEHELEQSLDFDPEFALRSANVTFPSFSELSEASPAATLLAAIKHQANLITELQTQLDETWLFVNAYNATESENLEQVQGERVMKAIDVEHVEGENEEEQSAHVSKKRKRSY